MHSLVLASQGIAMLRASRLCLEALLNPLVSSISCSEGVKRHIHVASLRCEMGLHHRYMFRTSGRIVVRCMADIAPGEELTLAYTNLAQPRARCVARAGLWLCY